MTPYKYHPLSFVSLFGNPQNRLIPNTRKLVVIPYLFCSSMFTVFVFDVHFPLTIQACPRAEKRGRTAYLYRTGGKRVPAGVWGGGPPH